MEPKGIGLTGEMLGALDFVGQQVPGGFLICRSAEAIPGEIVYSNREIWDLYGCEHAAQFQELTGGLFAGMVLPEDWEDVHRVLTDAKQKKTYLQYRIRRRDGQIRYVRSHTHFSDTSGGLYSVFVSDMTETREKMEEDKAVKDAVIQTLTNTYNTVWLINDLETESCSLYHGDTGMGSIHAEAIQNALSHSRYSDTQRQYVQTMVAIEDQPRMMEEISLAHIRSQFETKEQFSVTFLRDLPTGKRYYRVDFGKVYMPHGRIGAAMGFKDVDEEVRADQEIQQALLAGQRAEEENRRLIGEIESAAQFAQLMGSVASLLSNMPAMSFSKDAETGKYLACNQAFAEYAHKADPSGVMGLTDHEIFDPVTADHFVADDRRALSQDEPYIFFEDVPDAVGNPRNFQTTKLKFTDGTGRLCTLGMCVDVTEMTRIKAAEAEARVKQEELERRIALQEKLLQEERQRTQQEKLITALSSDYRGVYYVELDKNEGVCYQVHPDLSDGYQAGEHFRFVEGITNYARRFVSAPYQEEFFRFIQPRSIREGLSKVRVISYRYMVSRQGVQSYEMIRFAGVRHPEDRDDQMVHAVSMCFMDVDAEMRQTLEQSRTLTNALATAEEASRAKSAFLSNMSHEIRTPITGILGMNEMIQRESQNENVLRYSDNIQKAGVSLLGIISDILDFSKIEAGRMELVSDTYTTGELLTDSLNLVRLRADEKGLILQAEVDPALPAKLQGDELRVKQILTNLLSNAVKYTERGTVKLTCRLVEESEGCADISFAVTDTGIGIREEERDRLFSAFDRLDTARTRHIEGTGLGLAITYRMISLMGSQLQVDSVYGEGSTFYFTLRQIVVGEEKIGDFDPFAAPVQSTRASNRTPFTAPDVHILLVDDTPMNLQVIAGLLRRTEMQIDTADSGFACIDLFGENDYDLVFLDYRMPHMDGIETLHKLMELYPEKSSAIPIICLTASAVSGDREKMLEAGFTDYLTKPVNIQDMESMLLHYLPPERVHLEQPDAQPEEEEPIPSELLEIANLDAEAGVRFCGGLESYLEALEIYRQSVEKRAGVMERALETGDMPEYIIAVHSLKSTSRTVGATEISALAAALEEAGNTGDMDFVRTQTPKLLEIYRNLFADLQAFSDSRKGNQEDLPLLPDEELDEALHSIRDFVAAYDYDSVCMIMEMLEEYRLPEDPAQRMAHLQDAIQRCDWEAMDVALQAYGI